MSLRQKAWCQVILMSESIWDQTKNRVDSNIWSQVRNQIWIPNWRQVGDQGRDHAKNQVIEDLT